MFMENVITQLIMNNCNIIGKKNNIDMLKNTIVFVQGLIIIYYIYNIKIMRNGLELPTEKMTVLIINYFLECFLNIIY